KFRGSTPRPSRLRDISIPRNAISELVISCGDGALDFEVAGSRLPPRVRSLESKRDSRVSDFVGRRRSRATTRFEIPCRKRGQWSECSYWWRPTGRRILHFV